MIHAMWMRERLWRLKEDGASESLWRTENYNKMGLDHQGWGYKLMM